MEITFSVVRSKEIVNLYDGKRLGRVVDIVFDKESGRVLGFVVPGIKRMFRKSDDIFIPLENIKKIGDDVILVKLSPIEDNIKPTIKSEEEIRQNKIYARYRKPVSQEK